jgi:acyl-CoA synthetase (NDP forming)
MPAEITAERLTSLFRPRSVALVGASDKSAFSELAYHNLARFGYAERTYLVNRRAAQADLVAHAGELGMVLLGPNHLGFANFVDGVPVCSIPGLPRSSGPVALLSQSGASSSAMLDFATNPLRVDGAAIEALDAVVTWTRKDGS